jgi:hypothetical protein
MTTSSTHTPERDASIAEKGATVAHDHVENASLERTDTFELDLKNEHALKGDDSDGKVNWTWKQIIATISLSMIYTGKVLHFLRIV